MFYSGEVSTIDTNSRFVIAEECGDYNGQSWVASVGACKPIKTVTPPPYCAPRESNPIQPLDGRKVQTEAILSWGRGHALRASYVPLRKVLGSTLDGQGADSFGSVWFSNLHKAVAGEWAGGTGQFQYQRGDGEWKRFNRNAPRATSVLEHGPGRPGEAVHLRAARTPTAADLDDRRERRGHGCLRL